MQEISQKNQSKWEIKKLLLRREWKVVIEVQEQRWEEERLQIVGAAKSEERSPSLDLTKGTPKFVLGDRAMRGELKFQE